MKTKIIILLFILLFAALGKIYSQTASEWDKQAAQYYSQGNYIKAIECYSESKKIWESTLGKENINYAVSVNGLGLAYYSMGENKLAESCYLESIQIIEKVRGKDSADYAALSNNLGMLYYNTGNYAQAEKYFIETLRITEKVQGKENSGYATYLSNAGMLYQKTGNFELAERNYLESLGIRERVLGKNHPSYSISLNNLGMMYADIGSYAKAERFLLEAADIREKTQGKNHPSYATSLDNLGILYYNLANYKQAEKYYLESLGIRERVLGKNHPNYAISLSNLGMLYLNTGDNAQAERYLKEAALITEKTLGKEHPNYATFINNIGTFYFNIGSVAQAELYFLESIKIFEKVFGKEHHGYVLPVNNLGVFYMNTGNYTQAEHYLLESAGIRERILGKEHPDYAQSLNNLGNLYHHMGDLPQAERYYLKAFEIREKAFGSNHPDYAQSLNNLGVFYSHTGDYKKAERYYLETIKIYEKNPAKGHSDYITFLDNVFTLYLAKNEYNRARAYKQEAHNLNVNQINSNFSFLSEQQRDSFWNTRAVSFEAAYSLSFHNPAAENNILCYNNALFSKGLLLRTTNAVRDSIYASGNQALINQYEELGRLRQQVSNLIQNGGTSSANAQYIQSLEKQAEDLDKSLTQASAAFREFSEDLNIDWRNIRDKLQPNEAAIEFVSFKIFDKVWTEKTQYAALLLRHGMTSPVWIALCEESVLNKLFADISNERTIMGKTLKFYDDLGSDLYKAVWQPLEKELKNVKRIFYSPSGLLHKISFNAIPAGESEFCLIDIYELNLVSSTREIANRKTSSAKPQSAVVYGGIQYDADANTMRTQAKSYAALGTQTASAQLTRGSGGSKWQFLSATETERIEIQKLLSANKIKTAIYSGVNGNEESFKALSGKKTSLLHIATHGFFIEDIEKTTALFNLPQGKKVFDNPLLRSGLILAGGNNAWTGKPVANVEDGILFADEVAKINLVGTELVILSACETGLGTVNNSEGVFGLQRAFKLAGIQTLIMSLWEVDDEATSILINAFYKNWLSGKNKQDAFREAQRTLRKTEDFAEPFYWAAFVVMD